MPRTRPWLVTCKLIALQIHWLPGVVKFRFKNKKCSKHDHILQYSRITKLNVLIRNSFVIVYISLSNCLKLSLVKSQEFVYFLIETWLTKIFNILITFILVHKTDVKDYLYFIINSPLKAVFIFVMDLSLKASTLFKLFLSKTINAIYSQQKWYKHNLTVIYMLIKQRHILGETREWNFTWIILL